MTHSGQAGLCSAWQGQAKRRAVEGSEATAGRREGGRQAVVTPCHLGRLRLGQAVTWLSLSPRRTLWGGVGRPKPRGDGGGPLQRKEGRQSLLSWIHSSIDRQAGGQRRRGWAERWARQAGRQATMLLLSLHLLFLSLYLFFLGGSLSLSPGLSLLSLGRWAFRHFSQTIHLGLSVSGWR